MALHLGLCLWVSVTAPVAAARPELPSHDEFEQAVSDSRGLARQWGLQLRTGTLWSQALRMGSPMVAALQGQLCHLAYVGYSARGGAQPLFPDLPPDQRALWLRALVGHELVHCLLLQQRPLMQAAGLPVGLATAPAGADHDEVLADLGAAGLLLAAGGAHGPALVGLLADARARRAATDPQHDTSAVLQCLLAQRGLAHAPPPALASPLSAADAVAWLQAWRRQCGAREAAAGDPVPTQAAPPAFGAAAWAQALPPAAR